MSDMMVLMGQRVSYKLFVEMLKGQLEDGKIENVYLDMVEVYDIPHDIIPVRIMRKLDGSGAVLMTHVLEMPIGRNVRFEKTTFLADDAPPDAPITNIGLPPQS